MFLKILGRGKTKAIRTPCEIHSAFCMGCENFAHFANQFRTLCENKNTLRFFPHFAHYEIFAEHAKSSHTQHHFARCEKIKRREKTKKHSTISF